MQRADFRFFHRQRVRRPEVDLQGMVVHAHCLIYFDSALADYWRALALPYHETMPALGGELHLRKATLDFQAPTRLDDALEVGLRCARIDDSSIVFTGGLFWQNQWLAGGDLIHVFADPATRVARAVPAGLRQILRGYEAGEAMTEVVTGDWATLGQDAGGLRRQVFVEEQQIPEAMEWDDQDAVVTHAVARNRLGQTVATGRLLQEAAGVARIGRMAVHRQLRGGRLGESVLRALEEVARARGDRAVTLSAQRDAEGFYARLGYTPVGEPFEEAGIAHIEMTRALDSVLPR